MQGLPHRSYIGEQLLSFNFSNIDSLKTGVSMSSLEIAELTGKSHKNVMRDIRKMFESLGKSGSSSLSRQIDSRGKEQPVFALDRFHIEVLVTGYDIKRRAAAIERWYKLESGEPITSRSAVHARGLTWGAAGWDP